MALHDPYDLARFEAAQAPVIAQAFTELRAGCKRSHWMWFVFPQIAGLGFSAMAQRYAIGSLAEARAYLDHPILGPRLRRATALVTALEERSATSVFGSPDDMKFRSSMTLFAEAAGAEAAFRQALDRFFDGGADAATLDRLHELMRTSAPGRPFSR